MVFGKAWSMPRISAYMVLQGNLRRLYLNANRLELRELQKHESYWLFLNQSDPLCFELKNFSSNAWQSNLTKLMSEKVSDAGAEASEEIIANQLLSDLIKYIEDGYKGRQLWFTPDIVPGARSATEPLDAAVLAAKEDEVIHFIEQLLTKNEAKVAERYFDLAIEGERATVTSINEWNNIREKLSDALRGGGDPSMKFVRIYPFEMIVKDAI